MEPIAILVPMLGRPHRVVPLLDSIRATTPHARVLFVVSPGDADVHAQIDAAGEERMTVDYQPAGDYARKVNTGYRHTVEPLLFLAADDLKFHPCWYEQATSRLDHGIGVVGTNDLGSPRVMAGEHSTHSLVTRDYADKYGTIDGPGQILFEGYVHEFVDDELVGTAKHRRAFSFAFFSHVEHLHGNWGKEIPAPDGRPDVLYPQQQARMRQSAPL
jgi:hypothetical protein